MKKIGKFSDITIMVSYTCMHTHTHTLTHTHSRTHTHTHTHTHMLMLTSINSGCHACYKLLHAYTPYRRWLCVHHIVLSKFDCAVFYSGMLLGLRGKSYSPPGTRKTEPVKALRNLFGWKVLVFNCDEEALVDEVLF